MAEYLGALQPNLNPGRPRVKAVATQVIIDPLKTIWKCPLCGKSMPYLFRECHVKLHSVFSCPLCNDGYSFCDLSRHMIHCMDIGSSDEFRCTICGNLADSIRHIKTRHVNSLICLIPGCGRSFTISTFEGHVKNCLKNFAKRSPALPPSSSKTSLKQQEINDIKVPLFKCIFCANCPSTEFLLKKHIEKVHIKHSCPLCKARDIFEANFNDHVMKCLRKGPNLDNCPICGQILANKVDHIHKTHSTLKITCPSCKEKFKCGLIAAHAVTCQKQNIHKEDEILKMESQFKTVSSIEIPNANVNYFPKLQSLTKNSSLKPVLTTTPNFNPKTEPPKRDFSSNEKQTTNTNKNSSDSNPIPEIQHDRKQVSFQMLNTKPSGSSSDDDVELTSLFCESD